MKAICLKNKNHKEFITTAYIIQEWVVDNKGNFLEVTKEGNCLEVAHPPDPDNVWICKTCGSEAKVIDDIGR